MKDATHKLNDNGELVEKIATPKRVKLAYCDYIASVISKAINQTSHQRSFGMDWIRCKASKPQMDLHPEHGYFVSTKKTIEVTDHNGKQYTVTIEEK